MPQQSRLSSQELSEKVCVNVVLSFGIAGFGVGLGSLRFTSIYVFCLIFIVVLVSAGASVCDHLRTGTIRAKLIGPYI